MLDFLCIGAQKAGTTWLATQLDDNPRVWMHPFKELHYFDHLYYEPNRFWTLGHLQRLALMRIEGEMIRETALQRFDYVSYLTRCADREWAFTEAWYRYCFSIAPKSHRKGECTPAYSLIGREGVAHVKRMMPDVRIIYVIRDPVDRACSQIRMNVAHALSDVSVVDEARIWAEARKEDVELRSDYARAISIWEEAFGDTDQILYIPYGRIKSNPDEVLALVEDHIGVPPGPRHRMHARIHASADVPVSDEVRACLARRLEPQYDFLRRRFGDAFVSEV